MPPVLNRLIPDPHPYDDALKDWLRLGGNPSGENSAMARNIQWDHRVSGSRETQFDIGISVRPPNGPELRKTLDKYFNEKIRYSLSPAFLDGPTNGDNIVHGGPDNKDAFDQDRELVSVLDLHGLRREYAKAKRATWTEFEDYDIDGDDRELLAWLDRKLEGKPDPEQLSFIERILARLNESRNEAKRIPIRAESKPHEPAWVAFWDDFQRYLDDGPDRWCEVLGIPKVLDRVWVIILKYTVSEASTLVRPTQLDAGWYGHHFPSPPSASPIEGGRAMDLLLASPTTKPGPDIALLNEFIHPRIDLKKHHIVKVGRTTRATAGDGDVLRKRRMQHRQLLVSRCNMPLAGWMPDVV